MNSFIVKYISQKLRVIIIAGCIIFVLFLLFFHVSLAIQYVIGFLIGIVNFILQATAYNIILSSMYKRSGLIQILLYILRYLIIVLAAVKVVNHNASDILAYGAGLLTINFSLIISSYSRRLPAEKEG